MVIYITSYQVMDKPQWSFTHSTDTSVQSFFYGVRHQKESLPPTTTSGQIVSKSQQNLSKPRNSSSSSINLHDSISSDSNSDLDSSEDSDSDLDLVTVSNSGHGILDISYLNSALRCHQLLVHTVMRRGLLKFAVTFYHVIWNISPYVLDLYCLWSVYCHAYRRLS